MEYKLIRSKRKTLSVSIHDGQVTVKAPNKLDKAYIDKFVESKAKWIEKKTAEQRSKTALFTPITNGSAVLYHGAFYTIVRTTEYKKITLVGGALCVPVKYADRFGTDKAIAAWYKRIAAAELSVALENISQKIGLKYSTFSLTNARTKWGSCDGNCNIRLNWRLVMLDNGLLEYVLVHELCHTLHHDHSAAFWSEVKKYCPTCAAAKKRLKTYSTLTSMYR